MKVARVFAIAALLLALTSPASFAAAWDAQADFGLESNPAGAWSYGWEDTLGSTFNLFGMMQFAWEINPVWTDHHFDGVWDHSPAIWKNIGDVTRYGVKPGELCLHPGYGGEFAVVRWTSPVSGSVSIDGSFGAGDTGWMSYYVIKNGTPLWNTLRTNAGATFALSTSVSAGNTIDFVIGEGYWSGSTPLRVSISFVDEDGDGYSYPEDCNDASADINPDMFELPGNTTDENCDGDLGSCNPALAWSNHGQFVRCVAHEAGRLASEGYISEDEADGLVTSAAKTKVGK